MANHTSPAESREYLAHLAGLMGIKPDLSQEEIEGHIAELAHRADRVPTLPQILAMLDSALRGTAGCLSLHMLPSEAGDVSALLPGAKTTTHLVSGLNGGFDILTAAESTVGNLVVKATHRRPATGAEMTAEADRRAARVNRQTGAVAPELLVGLGVGAILGAALLLRGMFTGAPIGGFILLATCALLAVVGARLTQTPLPVKVPVLPEQAAALCLQVEAPEAVPVHIGRKRARRASGHMVSELAWGIGGAGVVLLACAALLSFLGVQ